MTKPITIPVGSVRFNIVCESCGATEESKYLSDMCSRHAHGPVGIMRASQEEIDRVMRASLAHVTIISARRRSGLTTHGLKLALDADGVFITRTPEEVPQRGIHVRGVGEVLVFMPFSCPTIIDDAHLLTDEALRALLAPPPEGYAQGPITLLAHPPTRGAGVLVDLVNLLGAQEMPAT